MTLANSFIQKAGPQLVDAIARGGECGTKLLGFVPFGVQHLLASPLLSWLTSELKKNTELEFMQNKILKLEVTDWQHQQYFSYCQQQLCLVEATEQPDITLSGPVASFVLLSTHSVDPDTLFFQRKLSITGDTELGLQVKCLFEHLEVETMPYPIKQALLSLSTVYAELLPS